MSFSFFKNGIAQNVGVGTPALVEKLDVNGNFNRSGQPKINGNASAANQTLMKVASNNLFLDKPFRV